MRRHLIGFVCLILALAAGAAPAQTGWILTSDYSTFGNVRGFTGTGPWSVSGDLGAVPGDAVARHHGGLVYVVGRGTFNSLQVWDPAAGFSLVAEHSLGDDLNPQDVAFDTSDEAYVSCYDAAVLLRVDPASGAILGSYSTAGFADADGLPETGWMVSVGDLLYIACQKLDRANWYTPTGPGALLVFDMAAETWVDMDPAAAGVQPIVLTGSNPYTRVLADDGVLAVGCAGQFGVADGGIETVDTASGTSGGFAVTEVELGGDLNRIQRHGDAWLAVVNDTSFNTFIARAAAGAVQVLDTGSGFVHADILVAAGDLYVLDRTLGADGLRVLDPVTGVDLTGGPLATGLPPAIFVSPDPGAPAAVPVTAPAALTLAAPSPNPFNPRTSLTLDGPPDARIRVAVTDLRGRILRRDLVLLDGQGRAQYRFDGRDAAGRTLPAGVYAVTAWAGGARAGRTMTLVK